MKNRTMRLQFPQTKTTPNHLLQRKPKKKPITGKKSRHHREITKYFTKIAFLRFNNDSEGNAKGGFCV